MNPYPFIAYAFYIGMTLSCFFMLNFAVARSNSAIDMRYISVLRFISCLQLIYIFATAGVFFLVFVQGLPLHSTYFINVSCFLIELLFLSWFMYSYFSNTIQLGAAIKIPMLIALVLIPSHPVLFHHYLDNLGFEFGVDTYDAFCQTKPVLAISAILFLTSILLGVYWMIRIFYHFFNFSAIYANYFANRKKEARQIRHFFILIFCFLLFTIVDCSISMDTYITYPFWAVFDLLLTIIVLRQRKTFDCMAHASQFVQLERIRKSLDDETSASAEAQIVKRLLTDWTQRQDAPWMTPGITIVDVANDLDLPVGVLKKYAPILIGCSFKDFIALLRNETSINREEE